MSKLAMKPDEIVVRYRQAKDKSEQLKILAELNACTVDEIIDVLCEHGGYKPQFFNKALDKIRRDSAQTVIKETDAEAAINIISSELAEIEHQINILIDRKTTIYDKLRMIVREDKEDAYQN